MKYGNKVVILLWTMLFLFLGTDASEYSPTHDGLSEIAGCKFGAVMKPEDWCDQMASFEPTSNFKGWYACAHLTDGERRAWSIWLTSKRFSNEAVAMKLYKKVAKYFQGQCKYGEVEKDGASTHIAMHREVDGRVVLNQWISIRCEKVVVCENSPDYEIKVEGTDMMVRDGTWKDFVRGSEKTRSSFGTDSVGKCTQKDTQFKSFDGLFGYAFEKPYPLVGGKNNVCIQSVEVQCLCQEAGFRTCRLSVMPISYRIVGISAVSKDSVSVTEHRRFVNDFATRMERDYGANMKISEDGLFASCTLFRTVKRYFRDGTPMIPAPNDLIELSGC